MWYTLLRPQRMLPWDLCRALDRIMIEEEVVYEHLENCKEGTSLSRTAIKQVCCYAPRAESNLGRCSALPVMIPLLFITIFGFCIQ
jgi:hypothetical protein